MEGGRATYWQRGACFLSAQSWNTGVFVAFRLEFRDPKRPPVKCSSSRVKGESKEGTTSLALLCPHSRPAQALQVCRLSKGRLERAHSFFLPFVNRKCLALNQFKKVPLGQFCRLGASDLILRPNSCHHFN